MKYLLDTNICVFLLHGKFNLDSIFKLHGLSNLYISEITAFELSYGAELSINKEKSQNQVKNFLAGISILPIYSTLELYSSEKVRLKKAGKPVHDEFDFLIALTAKQNNLIMVTDNSKDFINIESLELENWIVR
jgi:tRNA(fMet)-specific endonuclease VapC